jgi:8-amino-3,8-dideoxy-alpha-D-manno-octulosonate transaminase
VPYLVEKNNEHKKWLMSRLANIPGVSFARIPDTEGDSATFLNLLLPDTESAQAVVAELNAAGVGGFNYWFTNMYHFINQWDHLKELRTASKLAVQVLGAPQDYVHLDLPKSQEVIGRLISFGVRVTWTQTELETLANNLEKAIRKAMAAYTC